MSPADQLEPHPAAHPEPVVMDSMSTSAVDVAADADPGAVADAEPAAEMTDDLAADADPDALLRHRRQGRDSREGLHPEHDHPGVAHRPLPPEVGSPASGRDGAAPAVPEEPYPATVRSAPAAPPIDRGLPHDGLDLCQDTGSHNLENAGARPRAGTHSTGSAKITCWNGTLSARTMSLSVSWFPITAICTSITDDVAADADPDAVADEGPAHEIAEDDAEPVAEDEIEIQEDEVDNDLDGEVDDAEDAQVDGDADAEQQAAEEDAVAEEAAEGKSADQAAQEEAAEQEREDRAREEPERAEQEAAEQKAVDEEESADLAAQERVQHERADQEPAHAEPAEQEQAELEHADAERAEQACRVPPVVPIEVAPLPEHLSAREFLSTGQRIVLYGAVGVLALAVAVRLAFGLGPSPVALAAGFVAAATVGYVAVLLFKVVVVFAADSADVMTFTDDELRAVDATDLPDYTVLVPVYREGKVLPTLVERLSQLHYPAERMQILLLIEEDDDETRGALQTVTLSPSFEVILVPPSEPRTKPKACNHGMTIARGKFCVIYDAEDRPDPDQLLKAVAGFHRMPRWVVCIQAELQYWNPDTNWLTRCFAAEYAVNFTLWLRGLDRFRLPIPLGGTSNHFRTDALRELGAWDPHNVTEDADLGVRIFRRGWGVRMMDSVTEEEANSRVGNWIRQRSRWIKGFYQTWLVHMRSPVRLWRDLGTRDFWAFQMILGFSTITALLNPIFWGLTLYYLVDGPDRIAPLFPPVTLALGLVAMLAGNLLMVFTFMIGCMQRGLYRGVRTMLTVPAYWCLMSMAAYKAFFQLLRPSKRHFWELTDHGLVNDHPEAPPDGTPAGEPILAVACARTTV